MKNIVLLGFMGTGKTSVARLLGERLGRETVEMDALIEARAGKPISRIFSEEGEGRFRDLESAVCAELSARGGLVISAGGGVVLREENVENLRKNGVLVCLTTAPEKILQRTKGMSHRPLLNTKDPIRRIRELLAFRAPFYARIRRKIDTTPLTLEEVADRVLECVEGEIERTDGAREPERNAER